jgi:hypothetical protein
MNPIFAAGLEVERICRAARFRFCFIGGLAVQRWGRPRMTADVDLTVITGFGNEEPFVDALLAGLAGRIADARGFALRTGSMSPGSSSANPCSITRRSGTSYCRSSSSKRM